MASFVTHRPPELKNFLQSLSYKTEFALVVGIAFGWSCFVSILVVLSGFPADSGVFDDAGIYGTLAFEVMILLLLGLLLHSRSWRLGDFHLRPSWIGCAQALALAVGSFALYYLLAIAVQYVSPAGFAASNRAVAVSPALSITAIAIVSLINPLFEELFVTAYIVNVLEKRRGFWFAVNTSVAIRLTYHLYQGIPGLLMVLPAGLIFAAFYARQRSLWPLLVAHALWDFLPLYFNR